MIFVSAWVDGFEVSGVFANEEAARLAGFIASPPSPPMEPDDEEREDDTDE
jgi:hypothetical protein